MATFNCTKCDNISLSIKHSVRVPPKNPMSKDELVQTIQCSSCDFKGMALYKESRAGAIDDDHLNHDGYELDEASFAYLDELLSNSAKAEELAKLYAKSFQDSPIKIDWRGIFGITV